MLWGECNNKSTIRITEADGHSIWSDTVVAETEAVHPVVIRTYCVEARGNGEGQEGNHLGTKGLEIFMESWGILEALLVYVCGSSKI